MKIASKFLAFALIAQCGLVFSKGNASATTCVLDVCVLIKLTISDTVALPFAPAKVMP